MALLFKCPSCGMPLEFADDAAGTIVKCPECKTQMQVAGVSPPSVPLATSFSARSLPIPPSSGASLRFSCPTCKTIITAPAGSAGGKIPCPQCQQRLQIPGEMPRLNKTVLADPLPPAVSTPRRSRRDRDDFEPRVRKSSLNVFQRYQRWAGGRSVIFQAILLGWTAFAFLGSCGLLISAASPEPRTMYEEGRQNGAIAFLSCFSCGGYLLIAIPLLIAAIATLEFGKSRRS